MENMVYMIDGAIETLERSNEIMKDQELENYFNAQLEYRRTLAIAPISHVGTFKIKP